MNLIYLVDHLFLPPKLPQEDNSTSGGPQALLLDVKESATTFVQKLDGKNTATSFVAGHIYRRHSNERMTYV